MAQRIGTHLEQQGQGKFRLLGELPEGAMDGHLHLGTYLRMPVLGGLSLTGPGNYPENLAFHLSELRKHRAVICDGLRDLHPSALEGVVDVPPLKTELEGPGTEPVHLFTSMDGLFCRDEPCYLRVPARPSLGLLGDLATALRGFAGTLREANLVNLERYLDAYGLARAVVLPVETGRFSRFSPAAMEACQGRARVLPFFSVHPRNPKMEDRFAGLVRLGGRGVKFHPEFQGVAPDSPEALHLFELCSAAGLPVVCHVGGVQPGAAHSHPDRYGEAVRLFPHLTFILCHVGLADRDATLEIAARHGNVLLETSGQPVEGLCRAAERIGTDRILFGSDWPLYHPAVPISCVLDAFPGNRDRERVFRDNLADLLGLKERPSKAAAAAAEVRAGARRAAPARKKTATTRSAQPVPEPGTRKKAAPAGRPRKKESTGKAPAKRAAVGRRPAPPKPTGEKRAARKKPAKKQ